MFCMYFYGLPEGLDFKSFSAVKADKENEKIWVMVKGILTDCWQGGLKCQEKGDQGFATFHNKAIFVAAFNFL